MPIHFVKPTPNSKAIPVDPSGKPAPTWRKAHGKLPRKLSEMMAGVIASHPGEKYLNLPKHGS